MGPVELLEIEVQVKAEVAALSEALLLAASRIAKGVGEGGQRRGDTVLLKPRACTVPVAEQVLAGQDQLERRICQSPPSLRGARGVLGARADRPPHERQQ